LRFTKHYVSQSAEGGGWKLPVDYHSSDCPLGAQFNFVDIITYCGYNQTT